MDRFWVQVKTHARQHTRKVLLSLKLFTTDIRIKNLVLQPSDFFGIHKTQSSSIACPTVLLLTKG